MEKLTQNGFGVSLHLLTSLLMSELPDIGTGPHNTQRKFGKWGLEKGNPKSKQQCHI